MTSKPQSRDVTAALFKHFQKPEDKKRQDEIVANATARLQRALREAGGKEIPSGWIISAKQRENGISRGDIDYFYFAPDGRKYRSMKEAISLMLGQSAENSKQEQSSDDDDDAGPSTVPSSTVTRAGSHLNRADSAPPATRTRPSAAANSHAAKAPTPTPGTTPSAAKPTSSSAPASRPAATATKPTSGSGGGSRPAGTSGGGAASSKPTVVGSNNGSKAPVLSSKPTAGGTSTPATGVAGGAVAATVKPTVDGSGTPNVATTSADPSKNKKRDRKEEIRERERERKRRKRAEAAAAKAAALAAGLPPPTTAAAGGGGGAGTGAATGAGGGGTDKPKPVAPRHRDRGTDPDDMSDCSFSLGSNMTQLFKDIDGESDSEVSDYGPCLLAFRLARAIHKQTSIGTASLDVLAAAAEANSPPPTIQLTPAPTVDPAGLPTVPACEINTVTPDRDAVAMEVDEEACTATTQAGKANGLPVTHASGSPMVKSAENGDGASAAGGSSEGGVDGSVLLHTAVVEEPLNGNEECAGCVHKVNGPEFKQMDPSGKMDGGSGGKDEEMEDPQGKATEAGIDTDGKDQVDLSCGIQSPETADGMAAGKEDADRADKASGDSPDVVPGGAAGPAKRSMSKADKVDGERALSQPPSNDPADLALWEEGLWPPRRKTRAQAAAERGEPLPAQKKTGTSQAGTSKAGTDKSCEKGAEKKADVTDKKTDGATVKEEEEDVFDNEEAALVLAEGLAVAFRRRQLRTHEVVQRHAAGLLMSAGPAIEKMIKVVEGLQNAGIGGNLFKEYTQAVRRVKGAAKLLAGVPAVTKRPGANGK